MTRKVHLPSIAQLLPLSGPQPQLPQRSSSLSSSPPSLSQFPIQQEALISPLATSPEVTPNYLYGHSMPSVQTGRPGHTSPVLVTPRSEFSQHNGYPFPYTEPQQQQQHMHQISHQVHHYSHHYNHQQQMQQQQQQHQQHQQQQQQQQQQQHQQHTGATQINHHHQLLQHQHLPHQQVPGQAPHQVQHPVNQVQHPLQHAMDHQCFQSSAFPQYTLVVSPQSSKRSVKKRTRTGCLTCRRRRIKCDERKPGCQNCEKSKICCAGYQRQRPTKQELKKTNRVMRVGAILS